MKTVHWHGVRKWRVLAKQVTYTFKNNLDDYWRVTGYGHDERSMAN